MDLSHVLSYVLEPQLLGKNLSKTPLQTWWDLKDIEQQDRKKSSFLITWNCYIRGLVAKEKHFRGNAQSFKIYANHHAPVYVKFSACWIFNRDYHKPHFQLQINLQKRKERNSKLWMEMRDSGWGSSWGRSVVWPHKNGEGGDYSYKLDLDNTTLDPWKATFSNLAAWLVSTLIKTLNFLSF